MREIRAFGRFLAFECTNIHAVFLRETRGGCCGLTARIQSGRHWRTRYELFEIGLPFSQLRNAAGQSSRRAERFGRSIGLQPKLAKTCIKMLRQLPGEVLLIAMGTEKPGEGTTQLILIRRPALRIFMPWLAEQLR